MKFKFSKVIFLLLLSSIFRAQGAPLIDEDLPVIRKIIVEGNKYVKKDAILNRLPYKEGEKFDTEKTAIAINNLYMLGHFRQIQLEREDVADNAIHLYVVLEERKLLESITFTGNKVIKTKKIRSSLELDKLKTIDEEQLKRIVSAVQKLYKEENFHQVNIDYKIIVNKRVPDKASVAFHITEGKKARIRFVHFRGNDNMPSRKLRTLIFTREDWILGFMDDAGKYNEESLEMDKKRIEYYYREYGYLMAKVANTTVDFLKDDTEIHVTFDIREGERFYVRYISAPGDDLYNEDELLPYVEIEAGKPYCQSKLVKSIEKLKAQWGELGYIYADVYPQVVPNEETKEVDITFHVEKGKKMFVNRIDITGNKLTKDRVIRRELAIEEGDLITSRKLNRSKNSVEYLGFFERGAVNWKIHRLDDDQADVEMNVKEAKTGSANLMINYGSDKGSASRSVKIGLNVKKSNFLGRGWDIGAGVQTSLHNFKQGSIYFFDPHIFDTDISAGFNAYVKREEYEQWGILTPRPIERIRGASLGIGFLLPKWSRRTSVGMEFGIEHIKNNDPMPPDTLATLYQPIIDRTFQQGDNVWLGASLSKDTRNHRVYPSEGYRVEWRFKSSPPGLNSEFNFVKTEIDWSWYTALIGEDKLVLMLHASAGIVDSVASCDGIIPYKELFHMGGQTTVRGFVWGSIGPAWGAGDQAVPLGARKAFQFNAELIFPLVADYSIKGHVFYDAGAGWDTPKYGMTTQSLLRRDQFNLRHSVGFGLNLSNPFPAKIDWGYKLDRDKEAGESPHEFHISMNKAW